jgi:hypothetical protein
MSLLRKLRKDFYPTALRCSKSQETARSTRSTQLSFFSSTAEGDEIYAFKAPKLIARRLFRGSFGRKSTLHRCASLPSAATLLDVVVSMDEDPGGGDEIDDFPRASFPNESGLEMAGGDEVGVLHRACFKT